MIPEETKTFLSSKNHEFIIKMKFKFGDKVKAKPQFKEDSIYEITGFEYCTLIKNQFSVIRYCVMDSKSEEHWMKEDVLELHKPQQVSIPATEEEISYIESVPKLIVKSKWSNEIYVLPKEHEQYKKVCLIYNPDTKCWEDWRNEK